MRLHRTPPQLSYDHAFDRWMLWLPGQGSSSDIESSYCLAIKVGFMGEDKGWFDYRFLKFSMGDHVEVVSKPNYDQRLQDIRDHEGDEIAHLWDKHQMSVEVIYDQHPVFALRRHWEAMMELGLFMPSVNLQEWRIARPLSSEYEAEVNAIRDRQIRETVEEMKASDLLDAQAEKAATDDGTWDVDEDDIPRSRRTMGTGRRPMAKYGEQVDDDY
jgi:hypothetical protein